MGLFNALSCREASRRAAGGGLDASFLERALILLHLMICRHCRAFTRQLALLGAAARRRASGLASPAQVEALERRLLSRLGS